jgi:hypothetical protein
MEGYINRQFNTCVTLLPNAMGMVNQYSTLGMQLQDVMPLLQLE